MFKRGNEIKCVSNIGVIDELTVGEHYTVLLGEDDCVKVMNDIDVIRFYSNERFELIKPFSAEDVEIGNLVELDSNKFFIIDNDLALKSLQLRMRVITNALPLSKIFKLNDEGDFIKVWERPAKRLFTLSLPNNQLSKRFFRINKEDYTSYKFDANSPRGENDTYKWWFTNSEIGDLPNQELVNTLVQEVVNNEN